VLLISPICGEGIPVSRSITHARTHTAHVRRHASCLIYRYIKLYTHALLEISLIITS